MASVIGSVRAPQCLSCLRRVNSSISESWLASAQQQIRGKKRLAKQPSNIKVRLLKDVKRYGPQGAIIPLAPGRMRNEFYPKRKAEYMTRAQLEAIGEFASERDYQFGIAQPNMPPKTEDSTKDASAIPIDLDILSPERALKVLTLLIPANLDFYRTPIATPAPPPQRISPSIPASSSISAAAQALQGTKEGPATKAGIYGSVTTADIAANLKAILAEDESGSKISLSAEDIAFVEETEEKDRVKLLGVFEIDIKLKGATDVIRRTIKVNPQA